MRSIKWHERQIIKAAKLVAVAHRRASIVATATAVEMLTIAFDGYEQAVSDARVRARHESL